MLFSELISRITNVKELKIILLKIYIIVITFFVYIRPEIDKENAH